MFLDCLGLIGCPETSVTLPICAAWNARRAQISFSLPAQGWNHAYPYPRNEVTFMVVLGDCYATLVGFLQCRHNIHSSSATNPSYCPEGVLPKVKAAGGRIRHVCAQCQNRWCIALCHNSGCSALSLSVLCAEVVLIDLWICDVNPERWGYGYPVLTRK
jgi:hypothetical protein